MRVLFWDIEATSFYGDKGIILCIGYKWMHEKRPHILTIRKKHPQMRYLPEEKFFKQDAPLIKKFKKIIESADLHVYYYGSKFDSKFLQTRALLNGLPPIHYPKELDVIRLLWRHFKFSSNRMDNITKLLKHLPDHPGIDKTKFSQYLWWSACFGHTKALKLIEDHCARDVILLEYLFHKLKELDPSFPRYYSTALKKVLYGVCPYCESANYVRHAYHRNKTTRLLRLFCKDCGRTWSVPEKAFEHELKKGGKK